MRALLLLLCTARHVCLFSFCLTVGGLQHSSEGCHVTLGARVHTFTALDWLGWRPDSGP